MVKIAWIGIIVSLWLIKFPLENWFSQSIPNWIWFWLGAFGLIYFSHRLGKKGFNIKRWFK